MLDIDGVRNSTTKAAVDGIQWSLKKLGDTLKYFSGTTTDSGGGAVLCDLGSSLSNRALCNPFSYKYSPCTLHALQLSFANGIKTVFLEGKLTRRNIMQLIHSCYDLQSRLTKEERCLFWEFATDTPAPDAMSAAVLTRWWYVNTAALIASGAGISIANSQKRHLSSFVSQLCKS